eukprot:1719787-Prymnesium_polylepis.2
MRRPLRSDISVPPEPSAHATDAGAKKFSSVEPRRICISGRCTVLCAAVIPLWFDATAIPLNAAMDSGGNWCGVWPDRQTHRRPDRASRCRAARSAEMALWHH